MNDKFLLAAGAGLVVGAGYQSLTRPPTGSIKQAIHDGLGWKIGMYGTFGGLLLAAVAPNLRGPALAAAGVGMGMAATSMLQKGKP